MTDQTVTAGTAANLAPAAPTANQTPADRWDARTQEPASLRPGAISSADYHRLDPAEQSKFANLPGGQWIERSKLEAPADAMKPGEQPAKPGEAPSVTPSVTADGKLKVGTYELSSDDIAMLMQTKAAADLRATQVPADASGYEPKLPEGLTLPEGFDFRPDPTDPAFKDFQALSKKIGLTQSDFEQLYGIWVNKTVQSEAAFKASMKAELDKLGAHATTRVTALEVWLRGTVGDDLAKSMRAGMFSAKIVEGLERIQQKMVTQGHAPFSQAHREPNTTGPGRMGEEEYAGMSQAERYAYAKSFDQRQFK
jgi:hypothetical protein